MVFIPTYCWSWRQLLPSTNLPESLAPHFTNKQFSIDSFLDWEGHHWVFAHLHQTTATHALVMKLIKLDNHGLVLPCENLMYAQ